MYKAESPPNAPSGQPKHYYKEVPILMILYDPRFGVRPPQTQFGGKGKGWQSTSACNGLAVLHEWRKLRTIRWTVCSSAFSHKKKPKNESSVSITRFIFAAVKRNGAHSVLSLGFIGAETANCRRISRYQMGRADPPHLWHDSIPVCCLSGTNVRK